MPLSIATIHKGALQPKGVFDKEAREFLNNVPSATWGIEKDNLIGVTWFSSSLKVEIQRGIENTGSNV